MFEVKRIRLFVILIIWEIIAPYSVWSYIDPNTGGFFFTTILPFVYGLLGAVVIFWKRIVNFIKSKFSKKKDSDS